MVKTFKYAIAVFALICFTATVSYAQGSYGGSVDAREHGYQHGYRDGLRQGRADLNANARPNYDSEDYRHADLGYEPYLGERDDFRKGYREGYKAGYDDGYSGKQIRSDVYGLNDERYDPDRLPRRDQDDDNYSRWGYSDVAFDTGYRDGLSAGQKDWRDHKDYRPEKHDSFEDANHGYHKGYGDKSRYKEQYRKGFLRGYGDAFNRRR